MHSLASLCLFLTVSLSIWEMTESVKSVLYGQREFFDKLIYHTHAERDYEILTVLTETVKFPDEQASQGTITMMNVTDMYVDGNGGTAVLVSGGVGGDSATFSITSKRNHGFDFIFEIYGYPSFATP